MHSHTFRSKVIKARFLPRVVRQYVAKVIDTLNPEAQARIMHGLEIATSHAQAAITKAQKHVEVIENQQKNTSV